MVEAKVNNEIDKLNAIDNIIKKIEMCSSRNPVRKVFEDIITMFALSISNSRNFKEEREREYLSLANSYSKEEQEKISEITGIIMSHILDKEHIGYDVIGKVYERMNLTNRTMQQIFTPIHIADFMAKVSMDDISVKGINDAVKKDGFFIVQDDCCGSGRLLLGAYKVLKDLKIDLNKVIFKAWDIDSNCVKMTYIQLSFLGLNAMVVCGDSNTRQETDFFISPALCINPSMEKILENIKNQKLKDKELPEAEIDITD